MKRKKIAIIGGSSSYINPLTAGFGDRIRLNCPVLRVERADNEVKVITATDTTTFDEVIFACDGNQALSLLAHPSAEEESLLKEFKTSLNDIALHTDISFLPRRKLGWASWNYNLVDGASQQATLTYNMNILQRLKTKNTYLVTLNQDIPEEHALQRFSYSHPIFTLGAISAQKQWVNISGKNNSHFCGAYWLNVFHEDGVKSALRVCATMEAGT